MNLNICICKTRIITKNDTRNHHVPPDTRPQEGHTSSLQHFPQNAKPGGKTPEKPKPKDIPQNCPVLYNIIKLTKDKESLRKHFQINEDQRDRTINVIINDLREISDWGNTYKGLYWDK